MSRAEARERRLGEVLAADERLVWSGAPVSADALRATSFDPLLGLGLGAVALWLVVRGAMAGSPALVGAPLLAIGLWIVTTPRRHRWLAGRLCYAVTDRRALVVVEILGRRVRDVPRARIASRRRLQHADGSASFDFAAVLGRDPVAERAEPRLVDGFWGVADGDGAERALAALDVGE